MLRYRYCIIDGTQVHHTLLLFGLALDACATPISNDQRLQTANENEVRIFCNYFSLIQFRCLCLFVDDFMHYFMYCTEMVRQNGNVSKKKIYKFTANKRFHHNFESIAEHHLNVIVFVLMTKILIERIVLVRKIPRMYSTLVRTQRRLKHD